LIKTPHGEGFLPCSLAEGKYLLQPCVEVEKEKDDLRQNTIKGPFVVPNSDGSHPSKDINE